MQVRDDVGVTTPGFPVDTPPGARVSVAPAPRALRTVVVLLVVNLGLSIAVTLATVVARDSIVDFQLSARHITDPAVRASLRQGYSYGIVSRVVGNIVLSVVYVFLVRALLRGRRWAYRRVIWLGGVGAVSLVFLLGTPYPVWLHAEQVGQALVLAALVFFVLRPQVRAHFAQGLPGRDVRRFRR